MAGRSRWVFGVWLLVLVGLGAAAPSVFSSLAGAGWQANGSESVQVRELAQQVVWLANGKASFGPVNELLNTERMMGLLAGSH